jgi:hypothetical protein
VAVEVVEDTREETAGGEEAEVPARVCGAGAVKGVAGISVLGELAREGPKG